MSEIKDGGPAFPVPGLMEDPSFNGMSLRDRFAIAALPQLQFSFKGDANVDDIDIARMAYQQANAMLRARDAEVPACAVSKSLNARIADELRPFLKEGQKVIWREPFRWHGDRGVLSNHYECMSLEHIAQDFGYEVVLDFNHAAIVQPSRGGEA
ncbi:hypothetical protein C7S15_1618 [Burkholderia cepacia]|uniref:hypothetical protein n=1 Tax=Burkholderia cepacia TaxID=292 RepID=UPI00299019A3|nr:hypothetical protein [Burkholderia cepacia]MDW9227051.1 hypothetical protein [Burkholderia cepacia]